MTALSQSGLRGGEVSGVGNSGGLSLSARERFCLPPMRGRQITRLLQLVRLLARPGGVTAIEASRELDCVRRTFYRDIQVLEELCYPLYVETEGGMQRYRLRPGFQSQHRLPITHEELIALWLSREALGSLEGTPFADAARTLLDKLADALCEEVRARVDRARESLAVMPAGRRYGAQAGVVEALRRAAEQRRSVEIDYTPLGGRPARRVIDPYLLWLDPRTEALYVAGWTHDRRAVRTFLVDRIASVQHTVRSFDLPVDWSGPAYLAESFAAFRGPAATVRLAFRGRAARLVAERVWHPTQALRPLAPEGVELSMQVPLSPALTGWVLSWMPEVRVLSPAVLRGDVAAALRDGLAVATSVPGRRRSDAATLGVARPGYRAGSR